MTNDDEEEFDHIEQHPPERDIDEYIQNIDNFRIERMGADGVWINIFDEDKETDVHYHITCRDEGLHIRKRDEAQYRENQED